jgi:hypothetical protein
MGIHLKIVGSLCILLALMHIIIPKYFKWDKELTSVTLITKQILYVHTFFIGFMVFLMGLLCFVYSDELIETSLGRQICLGLFIFWFTRFIFQFWVYSPKVWRGKKFETIMHVIFSLLWSYFTVVFFTVYLNYQMI